MAVKLKLARIGKKGHADYRIIAIDESKRRNGKPVEVLGNYNPGTDPATVVLDKKRVEYWLSVGAQPTPTVSRIIKK